MTSGVLNLAQMPNLGGSFVASTGSTMTGNLDVSASSVFAATDVIGTSDNTATPGSGVVRAANASGVNAVGANLVLDAGDGTGAHTSGYLLFETAPPAGSSSSADGLGYTFLVHPNGNVGIGTTSPLASFHAAGNYALFGPGAGATPALVTLAGAYAGGTNVPGAPMYISASNGTGTGGSGSLYFQTAPPGSSGATANTMASILTLTNGGNVGIGTTSPSVALDVVSPTNTNAIVVGPASGTSSSGDVTGIGFRLRNTSGGAMNFVGAPGPDSLIGGVVQGTGNTSGLAFYTRASNVSMPERMRIDNNGNVGIGTTSPAGRLDIGTGSLCINSTCNSSWPSPSNEWAVSGSNIYNVNAGNVGIGTTAPAAALDVNGTANISGGVGTIISSTQPTSNFSSSSTGTYYTGEYLTITVPSGPSRRYRLVIRQTISPNSAGATNTSISLSTSSSSNTNLLTTYAYSAGGGNWNTVNAEFYVTLASGTTTTYYLWAGCSNNWNVINASSNNRAYSDFFAQPM